MAGSAEAFRVFISATSADLGEARSDLSRLLSEYGMEVHVQEKEPNSLSDGIAIQRVIDKADLCICLVGHCFGTSLPEEGVPGENIPADASWTQWELLYAIEKEDRRREQLGSAYASGLMVFFAEAALGGDFETEALRARQRSFAEAARNALITRFGRTFYRTFPDIHRLLDDIERAIRKPEGLFEDYRVRRWERLKAAFVAHGASHWLQDFAEGSALTAFGAKAEEWFKSEALFSREQAPLIDNQQFELLVPDSSLRQLAYFRRGAMVAGADAAEDEKHRAEIADLGFSEIMAALAGEGSAAQKLAPRRRRLEGKGLRLALVTAGGIGKTTTMERLQYCLNKGGAHLAILLHARDFLHEDRGAQANLDHVLERFLPRLGLEWGALGIANDGSDAPLPRGEDQMLVRARSLARFGIEREAKAGRLVILMDGLDHVDETPPALARLQNEDFWRNTHIVVAGRHQALSGWKEADDTPGVPDARCWRFITPLEFTNDQAKAYLGGFVDESGARIWRYDLLSTDLRGLLRIPRVLEHIRTLEPADLMAARTASDIYYRAVRNLLERALSVSQGKLSSSQIGHFMGLLSALAFHTIFLEPTRLRSKDESDHFLLNPDQRKDLFKRVRHFYGGQGDAAWDRFEADLRRLAGLSTLVGNGLLDNEEGVPGDLRKVLWASRTVQQFMAAYWLAIHAPSELDGSEGEPDGSWFACALFHPYAADSDQTEDLNRFLAEMPAAHITPSSWLAAARAWYDPDRVRGPDGSGLWSSEMIARSWRTMHALANRPVDDWWDISYETLTRVSMAERPAASLHPPVNCSATYGVVRAAGACLDKFLGDFQRLLDGEDSESAAAAHALIDTDWRAISSCSFRMGSREQDQGFPPKTLAYWKEHLGRVRTREDARREAEEVCPKAWWSGAYGERQRKAELAWLEHEVFGPYADAIERDNSKESLEQALEDALDKLRNNFRRRDETPAERFQRVKSFTLAASPVVNKVYRLFAPGHFRAAQGELDEAVRSMTLEQRTQARERFPSERWHADERPTIFVTWYDAWAFCQWANWMQDGQHYGCRLPHEPEWEFAAKHAPGPDGQPRKTKFGQFYWWGRSFYDDYKSAVEEAKSTPEAHAVGWPGATRPPSEAAPNGLGLRDMIGNVWEWCANVYDLRPERQLIQDEGNSAYSRHQPRTGPRPNAPRSMRGGIWYYVNHLSTAASRFRLEPSDADYKTGFRLVRELRS